MRNNIIIVALFTLFLTAVSLEKTTSSSEECRADECVDTSGEGVVSLATNKDADASPNVADEARSHELANSTAKSNVTTGQQQSRKPRRASSSSDSFPAPDICALYLAPSTLPHAGLGLFSGVFIPDHADANSHLSGTHAGFDPSDAPLWTDLYIPVADVFKSHPYRGQRRFPSWLAYIWPSKHSESHVRKAQRTFPPFPDFIRGYDEGVSHADGLKFFMDDYADDKKAELGKRDPNARPKLEIPAFVPGLASLANSHPRLYNLDRSYETSRVDYEGQVAPWQPGAGAFTPHHGLEFVTTVEVWAGMELLLDYGDEWNARIGDKLKEWQKLRNKKDNNQTGFVKGIDRKWESINEIEKSMCPEELPTQKGKMDRIAVGMAVDASMLKGGEKPYTEYRKNTYRPLNTKSQEIVRTPGPRSSTDITRSLNWLGQHGICLSNGRLKVDKSRIPYAGRGLFTTARFKKGEVVLTTPLLTLRKDDVTIYKSDPLQPSMRNVVDENTIIGYEMLMNYAFGHPNSTVLLVPLAPLANFINHDPQMKNQTPGLKSKGANVEVRWPKNGGNAAKLFSWTYQRNLFDEDGGYQDHINDDFVSNPWLKDHPIDVLERSGKLALEYVALRDIHNGEEILLDYGPLWDKAWMDFSLTSPYSRFGYFRHSIDVPPGFYPDNWLGVSDRYEVAETDDLVNHRLVGKVVPLTWAHNGKPISSKYAYALGLPKGFSEKLLRYANEKGIIELFRKLLTEEAGYHLPSDGFAVYNSETLVEGSSARLNVNSSSMDFFAHRYHSTAFNFNMHYVAAWNEAARRDILEALGMSGFDSAIKGIGERFGYDNMTCFHASFMGVTHCDNSNMHSDIYATEDKSWNIVFPLMTVEGTSPELDIMAEDMNTVIGVHYLQDVAYIMGDFGYHQTRPIDYYNPNDGKVGDTYNKNAGGVPIRVVFGAYCSQIDESNVAMIRHVYDGDDPAPFADQFVEVPMREIHWDRLLEEVSLAKPLG